MKTSTPDVQNKRSICQRRTRTTRPWKQILGLGAALVAFLANNSAHPVITQQPVDQSVSPGANAKFAITAAGAGPLPYQWRFNDLQLYNATNDGLIITNVQLTNAGAYSVVVANVSGSVTSSVARLVVDPSFTKITAGSIVTNVANAVGCAWGDYDNDGFIDLIVTSAASYATGNAEKNSLFHNNRDGTFSKVTNSVISAEARDWRGCSWADYDNDGNLDLLVTSSDGNGIPSANELFRNNGDGTFTKMTSSSAGNIVSVGGHSENCVWADYDNDGFLDVYIARYGPDWLFHNNGDGSFSQVTTNIGIPIENADSYSAMWSDYDNDGWPDLFVTVKDDTQANQKNVLFHNNRDGTFAKVAIGRIVTDKEYSIGCAWGDYDNDGYPDLFVTNGKISPAANSLYHNNRDGTFTKMIGNTVRSITSDVAAFSACAWGDYDNDGHLDLFVTALGTGTNSGTNYLYHNNGDGSFTRVLSGSLVNDPGFAVGCAWGDYDNDGFLDLFVARLANDGSFLPTTSLLYRNNRNSNAWLKVGLVGTVSNRSGIGAKVRLLATIRGQAIWQLREINTGSGGAGSSLIAQFGLGDATNIDLLRIEWPSGIQQTLSNLAVKQNLTVVEPSRLSFMESAEGSRKISLRSGRGFTYALEASSDLTSWLPLQTNTSSGLTLEFQDAYVANVSRRFYRTRLLKP